MVWNDFKPVKSFESTISRVTPSLTEYSTHANTPFDCLKLFISSDVIELTVKYTNKHAAEEENWKTLDEAELWGYFAILIVMGSLKLKKCSTTSLWTSQYFFRMPFFSTVMSRNRFVEITKHLRFDDTTNRDSRIESTGDKCSAIREIFEVIRQNCMKAYSPSSTITIDERLIPFRGNCSFKVYMPAKPSKYGIKLWVAADATNYYACNLQLYFGGNYILQHIL